MRGSGHQSARRVVEQLVDREAAREEALAPAIVDDHLEDWTAGFHAEPVRIERAGIGQSGALLAPVEHRGVRGWRWNAGEFEQYMNAVALAVGYVDQLQLGDQ